MGSHDITSMHGPECFPSHPFHTITIERFVSIIQMDELAFKMIRDMSERMPLPEGILVVFSSTSVFYQVSQDVLLCSLHSF